MVIDAVARLVKVISAIKGNIFKGYTEFRSWESTGLDARLTNAHLGNATAPPPGKQLGSI